MRIKKKFVMIQLILGCWLLLAPATLASEMTVDVGVEFGDILVDNPPANEPIKTVVETPKKVMTLPQTGESINRSILGLGGLMLAGVTYVVGVRMKGGKE
ncbi:LPXTG cell wall anchor domain-containing protein [uncultured Vagococcus sp.]|uniref:LPXTG cell wall anchor domain-containing protein n=1 Tax=uncultured Vagococcus sp. TaxID=189676 RepID=UPI0028D86362|nr:LPXTG cell wall anchor domain-containing protein [uncultured Vagococcus sp.]